MSEFDPLLFQVAPHQCFHQAQIALQCQYLLGHHFYLQYHLSLQKLVHSIGFLSAKPQSVILSASLPPIQAKVAEKILIYRLESIVNCIITLCSNDQFVTDIKRYLDVHKVMGPHTPW